MSIEGGTVNDFSRITTQDHSASRSDDCGEVLQTSRRGFCNGLLLTSAALVIAGKGATSETSAQADVLANPLVKIQGAEALMPGSSMLFNYPTRNDPSILVRTQEGQYYAYSQPCAPRLFDPLRSQSALPAMSVSSAGLRRDEWCSALWAAQALAGSNLPADARR